METSTSADLFREDTPVEQYKIGERAIFVKRDDLYGICPAPPLGKLRGLRLLLQRLHHEGVRTVGCWDTRVSRLGHGVAAAARELPGMRVIVSYPRLCRGEEPEAIRAAAALGAEIFPAPAGRINFSFARAREYVTARGGYMLPFGLECPEAVEGVARAATTLPSSKVEGGTVVVCCGSGVTLAGMLSGLLIPPQRLVGVSVGRAPASIARCIGHYVGAIPRWVEIIPAEVLYSRAATDTCPFPSHPHYDLKAWRYLCRELTNFTDPILFWNVGA